MVASLFTTSRPSLEMTRGMTKREWDFLKTPKARSVFCTERAFICCVTQTSRGKAQGQAARAFLHERVGQPIFHVARMAARGYLCSILCNPNALQPRTSRRQERTKHIPPSGAERQVVHMHHNGWAEVFGADASGFKVPALFESCAFVGSPLAVASRLPGFQRTETNRSPIKRLK